MRFAKRLIASIWSTFWSVARTGSLAKACEELNLSARTISSELRRLEERLGKKIAIAPAHAGNG